MKKLKAGRRARRSFTPEFKSAAVRLVRNGKSATQVAGSAARLVLGDRLFDGRAPRVGVVLFDVDR